MIKPCKKSDDVNEILDGVVKIQIYKFCTVRKVVSSMRKLNTALKASNIIICSDEYLHKFIQRIAQIRERKVKTLTRN